jgi:hypothetical protein
MLGGAGAGVDGVVVVVAFGSMVIVPVGVAIVLRWFLQ